VDILKHLESKGADIHAKTHDGSTAYLLAVVYNPNAHISTYLASESQNAGSQYKTVQGTGSGTNRNGALLAAKQSALKNAVGERLAFMETGRSSIMTFSDDEGDVSTAAQGFGEGYEKRIEGNVSDVKILSESQSGGLFHFTIEAKVRMN